jgi:hypothetical protein
MWRADAYEETTHRIYLQNCYFAFFELQMLDPSGFGKLPNLGTAGNIPSDADIQLPLALDHRTYLRRDIRQIFARLPPFWRRGRCWAGKQHEM